MKIIFTTRVFDVWFGKLRDKIAVAKIKARMDRLEMGNAGDAKPVGEGISELRIHCGAGTAFILLNEALRWLYFFVAVIKAVSKKTLKKPSVWQKNYRRL